MSVALALAARRPPSVDRPLVRRVAAVFIERTDMAVALSGARLLVLLHSQVRLGCKMQRNFVGLRLCDAEQA